MTCKPHYRAHLGLIDFILYYLQSDRVFTGGGVGEGGGGLHQI